GADERRALRRALGLPEEETIALFCGRLAEEKRPEVLVEALRHAPGVLVVAGDGAQAARLAGLAAQPARQGRVLIRPTVEAPAPLYRAADVYGSAWAQEGLSNAVLEAMASGLPVVAAPAGGMRRLLGAGAGVLVRDGSPQALGTAVAALAAAPSARARLGETARARAQRDFSLDATASLLSDLYCDLTGRHVPATRPSRPVRAPTLVP